MAFRGKSSGVPVGGPTANPEVRLLKDDVSQAFRNQNKQVPFMNGVLLDVTFTAGSGLVQTVAHKLDGACRGAWVVDIDGLAVVYRQNATGNQANTHVRLVASGACKAKVWVWR